MQAIVSMFGERYVCWTALHPCISMYSVLYVPEALYPGALYSLRSALLKLCVPELYVLHVLCSSVKLCVSEFCVPVVHKVLMKDSLNTEPRKHKHFFIFFFSTNFREHRAAAGMTSKYSSVKLVRPAHAAMQFFRLSEMGVVPVLSAACRCQCLSVCSETYLM